MKVNKLGLMVLAVALASGIGAQAQAVSHNAGFMPLRSKCSVVQARPITSGGNTWIPAVSLKGDDCWLDYDVNNHSSETYWLQYSLRHGESQWAVSVDGYYGNVTKRAVLNVQRKRYVYADGVYGPVTGRAMYWREGNGDRIGKWR